MQLNSATSESYLLVFILLYVQNTRQLDLNGAEGSYIKYPPWRPCDNGTLSFEFKTQQLNALLLYSDEGISRSSFLQIKLVGGSVILDLKLKNEVLRLSVGSGLQNMEWHYVQVFRKKLLTRLIVDKMSQSVSFRSLSLAKPSNFSKGFVFIGGVPSQLEAKMSSLSLPTVLFEPRLRGSVRNVVYKNCGGFFERPKMLDFQGVIDFKMDRCMTKNPCLNNGICLSVADDTKCDCSGTDFKGPFCDLRKSALVTTFSGKEYLSYDLSTHGDPIVSNRDVVSLQFKTRLSHSLLFYTGYKRDYILISIQDGQIHVSVNLGSGEFTRNFLDRVNDNSWHEVKVEREARETKISIDGFTKLMESTSGNYTLLSSNVMYVGGYPINDLKLRDLGVRSNFKGCLKKVEYKADGISLNILELAQSQHSLINVRGQIKFGQCRHSAKPVAISFTSPEAYLQLDGYWTVNGNATLSIKFSTNENTGLLFYSQDGDQNSDFLLLEIVDSFPYFVTNIGSEVIRRKLSELSVSDGHPHIIKIVHSGHRGSVRFDKTLTHYSSTSTRDVLTLSDTVYVGGTDKKHPNLLYTWSETLGHGFVGCIHSLILNNKKVHLAAEAKKRSVKGIRKKCRLDKNQCSRHPCLHRGSCVSGWNRYICQCHQTDYYGSKCQSLATTFIFGGNHQINIQFSPPIETEVDDIFMRFRSKSTTGLLLTTRSERSYDFLEVRIIAGHVQIAMDLGLGIKLFKSSVIVMDDQWHTAYIKRRANEITLQVDNEDPVIGFVEADRVVLTVGSVNVGQKSVTENTLYGTLPFTGAMQQFVLNGKYIFEMIFEKKLKTARYNATLSRQPQDLYKPINFISQTSYAMIKNVRQFASQFLSVNFLFRTTERDGLLFYTGVHDDFVAIEITYGQIYFIYSVRYNSDRVRVKTRTLLNDNQWHEISVKETSNGFLIRIDDHPATDELFLNDMSPQFVIKHPIYVGSVHKTMFKAMSGNVLSRHGFQGCLASLEINDEKVNLFDSKNVVGAINKGCKGPSDQCRPNQCLNSGMCIQHWTSSRCNCDLTSYTGPRCSDESVSYKFGANPGLISYNFPEQDRPSTRTDSLALGIITYERDCTLVRVESGNSNDYIEVEIVDGNVYVTYNMGTADYPIGELFAKVNDGKYHVIRFVRHGPNSTIQLDNLVVQHKNPQAFAWLLTQPKRMGKQLNEFNSQSVILVGGKKDQRGRIINNFKGTMSGLVYNGIQVLDLAADNSELVTVEGDVAISIIENGDSYDYNNGVENWQSTEGIQTTMKQSVTDDIIFVAAGSGCHTDDEDDCLEATTGHEDDIITPVIIVTTPTSKPRSDKPIVDPGGQNLCTDDNCSKGMEKDKNGQMTTKSHQRKEMTTSRPLKVQTFSTPRITPTKKGIKPRPIKNSTNLGGKVKINESENTESATSDLDIGLIIGIAVGVLIALVILIVLLYKYRRRDNGAYKVEETQTFAFIAEGNRTPQRNGNSKPTPTTPITKSKKRDVKEWYV